MKKSFIAVLIIVSVLLLLAPMGGRAQTLSLQTNKKVYVSGEEVGFKCTLAQEDQTSNRCLFVDVCGEGYLISSLVLKPTKGAWSGYILLPDTLQTGVYLFRAYVGNNNGQPSVVAEPITVFNRFGNNEINTERKSKREYVALVQSNIPEFTNDEKLIIQSSHQQIGPDQTIKFKIENRMTETNGDLSFSVFKVDHEMEYDVQATPEFEPYTPSKQVRIYESLVLSGRISDSKQNQPVSDETVVLSIPDSIPTINYAYTNEDGEFRFVLDNLYGTQNLIIQTINKQLNYNITLNPALLLAPTRIPYFIPVNVEASEFVQQAIQRATMHKVYAKSIEAAEHKSRQLFPFYGHTEYRIYPNNFVPLDDFNEIAWEILPMVRYKSDKDSTYLRIWDPNTKAFFYNPWTLVDGVPIYDHAAINRLNSEKISWIEIQPQVRCYGDLLVEGVLAIETINGDFSEIELPGNSIRKTIETFNEDVYQAKPELPIFRDVLYWNPALLSDQSFIDVTVNSSFERGTYIAIAQTTDQTGKAHQSLFKFKVE